MQTPATQKEVVAAILHKPHCTTCGAELPAHKTTCKFNTQGKTATAAAPALAPHAERVEAPRITWSGIATTLKAAHLGGRPRTLTIRAVRMEETMPQPGHPKQTPVLYFREQPQRFILGDGNQTALLELFGDDVSKCVGQKITLAPVRWGKRNIVRIVSQAQAVEPPAEPPDDF
jgi:hypothetical protein